MRGWRHHLLALVCAATSGCYQGMQGDLGGAQSHGDAGDGADDSDPSAEHCAHREAGAVYLRRLTNTEYRNTIRDLFGEGLDASSLGLPADPVAEGFDNNAEAITISELHVERYRAAAESIAAAVVSDPTRREAVVGCDLTVVGCLEAFVSSFGRRAFRRSLEDAEIAELLALASAADGDPAYSARLAIEGILQSVNFLYRIEAGVPDPDDSTRLRLPGPAVATRLSYFILASTPPTWLIDRAEAGELDDPEGVEAAARELSSDPAAKLGLRNFYAQWLQLPLLSRSNRDPATHPAWSEDLRASMVEQTHRLVDDFIWGDEPSLLELLTADHVWIDANLAELYEVPPPGDGWEPLGTAEDPFRGGLLTLPSIATLTGNHESGMPIYRGKFIREALLCEKMPAPPPDIPTVPDPVEGESDRNRLERHRSDPTCAGCHNLLEPLGFGLAHYDGIGAVRLADSQGQPISAEGSFGGFDAVDFDGALELQQKLRDDPAVAQCVVTQLFRYAFARREQPGDACLLEALGQQFSASDHVLVDLLVAFVRSDAFRTRPLVEEEV